MDWKHGSVPNIRQKPTPCVFCATVTGFVPAHPSELWVLGAAGTHEAAAAVFQRGFCHLVEAAQLTPTTPTPGNLCLKSSGATTVSNNQKKKPKKQTNPTPQNQPTKPKLKANNKKDTAKQTKPIKNVFTSSSIAPCKTFYWLIYCKMLPLIYP